MDPVPLTSMVMRRLQHALALLLVVLVAFGGLAAFAPHTDDGCPTEIHCQACRTGLANLAVVEALDTSTPHLIVSGAVDSVPESTLELLVAMPHLLRGPPAAA
jgi:hypothetical protein